MALQESREYDVRRFRAADTADFLSLLEQTLRSHSNGRAWFDWKYVRNPYADHVPIFVADHDGDVVGACAFLALEMAVGGRRRQVLQPVDTMVHPDHRKQGLFTRMTERALDRYADDSPAFLFNFPNEQVLPGYQKLGWRRAGDLSKGYRVENARAVLGKYGSGPVARAARAVGAPLIAGHNSVRDATAPTLRASSVSATRSVPAGELAEIYRETVPDGIHAVRDETFYEWRFSNPEKQYRTYVAPGPAGPVGITLADTAADSSITHVVDAVPIGPDVRTETKTALLGHILAEASTADLFVVPSSILPAAALRRLGIYPDTSPFLSSVVPRRARIVRGFGDWVLDGVDITDPENWALTFAELDMP